MTLEFLLVFALLVIVLISSGFYLLFYKRKVPLVSEPPLWMNKLSESARNVRLKEFNKQIPKVFSKQWFLEYWRGQRSPFNAWVTWYFLGGLFFFVFAIVAAFLFGNGWLVLLIEYLLLLLYTIMSFSILWGCAVNTTTFCKYFSRIFALSITSKLFINNFLILLIFQCIFTSTYSHS